MFVSKRALTQAELRISEQRAAYEARISDLRGQIQDLKKLVFSPTSASQIPLVTLEADSILSQKEETIVFSEEEMKNLMEEESERNRLLSGMY